MRKLNNGYCDYYYLTEDGKIYNENTGEYKEPNKDNRFVLMQLDGKRKKTALRVLYKLVYDKPYCKDDICDLEEEKWKEVENTNGLYFVSNKGRIKSYNGYNAIILKATKTRNGYHRIDIVQDGERVSKYVHRLVAIAFLPLPSKVDMELHHKDYNKDNNCSNNLEWLTIAEHKKKHRERIKENAKL